VKFGDLFWLLAMPILVLALTALWIWSARRARITMQSAFNTPLLARLLSSVNPARRWLKRGLFGLGIGGLILALARPQWGRSEIELERTGVDLIVALDVSRSMLADDVGPTNRLTAATTAVGRLLGELGGDRVGLVVFAGEAFMTAPLTRDHVAVERALNSAGPAMISEQGSNLGEAIKVAKESFDRAAPGPRALLVVSDGEQLQGDAVEAAQKALREGIRVHTAGVGSATGSRVPIRVAQAPGFVHNALGREVVSRRDEQQLQRIALAGGGLYTRIEEANSQALVDWFRRAAATLPRITEKRVVNEPRERFQWPLSVALVILAGEWMLGDRKRRTAYEPGEI
jgi:Ca-activated chloride channel family protein